MTKDKERDDALIAEARELDEARHLEAIRRSPVIGPGNPFDDATVHRHYRQLVRENWQPAPKPDRAEVLAQALWDQWTLKASEVIDAQSLINDAFNELRAEWEAERPAVVVPENVAEAAEWIWAHKALSSRENLVMHFIRSLDGAKGGE